jgi:hypothetical protein
MPRSAKQRHHRKGGTKLYTASMSVYERSALVPTGRVYVIRANMPIKAKLVARKKFEEEHPTAEQGPVEVEEVKVLDADEELGRPIPESVVRVQRENPKSKGLY